VIIEVLCIHVKRFSHNSYFGSKISRHVIFPLINLDISQFMKPIAPPSLSSPSSTPTAAASSSSTPSAARRPASAATTPASRNTPPSSAPLYALSYHTFSFGFSSHMYAFVAVIDRHHIYMIYVVWYVIWVV
jgi:hypothetical protein